MNIGRLQIDRGYVTRLCVISNGAPTPSLNLVRPWGGEVAPMGAFVDERKRRGPAGSGEHSPLLDGHSAPLLVVRETVIEPPASTLPGLAASVWSAFMMVLVRPRRCF